MTRFVLVLGVLAGCAAPPAVLPAPTPAHSTASSVSLRPLDPVRQPDLPAVLRAAPVASPMDHSAMDHSAMDHSAMAGGELEATSSATPLAASLDAYLALHAALASDTFDGVATHANALIAAFELAIEDAPADDPHLWHMRAQETSTVLAAARDLAGTADLVAAREAFGRLSAPFASLVEAAGAPEGYNLVRQTCGMQPDAPEGGVWLQRAGDVRNPYFGAAMQMCARDRAPVPDADASPVGDAHDHEAMHGDQR